MTDDLRGELLKLRPANREPEFVSVTERGTRRQNNLYRQLRNTGKRAGVRTEGLMLHTFRHTFATQLARERVNPKTVQKLLGHADVRTTLKHYTRMSFADMKDAVDRLVGGGGRRGADRAPWRQKLSQAATG